MGCVSSNKPVESEFTQQCQPEYDRDNTIRRMNDMTSYERTKKFINAEPVDHPPFMPLLIQMVPGFHGVTFFDTITDP